MATAKETANGRHAHQASGELPGQEPAGREPVLRTLSPVECYDLLEPGGVGRVAVAATAGITILPVNFAMTGQTIVFRTAPDSLLAVYANAPVAFETDHLDEALQEGWSVLVNGHAHKITKERELSGLEHQAKVQPWAGGTRDVYVRIVPTRISGRRVLGNRVAFGPQLRAERPY
jgi:nitroimidazol reductase NimA-like FMN-containing flavoprotein (pyridoxamine 5'-phosphate oxidase superfamily)